MCYHLNNSRHSGPSSAMDSAYLLPFLFAPNPPGLGSRFNISIEPPWFSKFLRHSSGRRGYVVRTHASAKHGLALLHYLASHHLPSPTYCLCEVPEETAPGASSDPLTGISNLYNTCETPSSQKKCAASSSGATTGAFQNSYW